ncbi:hypothetical protein ACQR7C_10810 [Salmonella enterica]|uniref:hypothetical protein n=1 Tax=Salmonella enterica TaxID=28901 RepID=UPI003D2EC29B
MKPAAICILCENATTGPDDERYIWLTDGTQLRARNIRREITLEPTSYVQKKTARGNS